MIGLIFKTLIDIDTGAFEFKIRGMLNSIGQIIQIQLDCDERVKTIRKTWVG